MDNPASATSPRVNSRSQVIRALRLAFIVVVSAWLAWALLQSAWNRDDLITLWLLPGTWLFLFGWLVIPVGLWLLWRFQLGLLAGRQLPLSTTLAIQAIAWGGRYMPGKAGLWLAKTAFTRGQNISWRILSASVVIEQALFLVAGILVSALVIVNIEDDALVHLPQPLTKVLNALLAYPVVSLVVLGAVVLTAITAIAVVSARALGDTAGRLNWFHWPALLAGYAAIHLIVGLALYPLIASLIPEAASALGPTGISGALALANIGGIAAFFAPAGLGVREAILASILAIGVGYDQALAVAILIRIVTVVADSLFAVTGWMTGKLSEP